MCSDVVGIVKPPRSLEEQCPILDSLQARLGGQPRWKPRIPGRLALLSPSLLRLPPPYPQDGRGKATRKSPSSCSPPISPNENSHLVRGFTPWKLLLELGDAPHPTPSILAPSEVSPRTVHKVALLMGVEYCPRNLVRSAEDGSFADYIHRRCQGALPPEPAPDSSCWFASNLYRGRPGRYGSTCPSPRGPASHARALRTFSSR